MTGLELRALREAAGIGVRELARMIGRDHGHLSRVENGERQPTSALVAAYRAALDPANVDDVRRRNFLMISAAALPALAAQPEPPARVGASEVAAIRSLALDVDLSHPFAVQIAETALQRAGSMLHARVSKQIRPELHAAVALLADRVGWAQFESGRDHAPTLVYAQRTAEYGDDPDLRAHALLDLAVTIEDPRAALATLDHALTLPVSGAERVNLNAVAARRAAPSDPRAATEYLTRALALAPVPGSEWSARMISPAGHLDAIIGFACYATGHPDSRERLTLAASTLAPHRRRTRARCHVRLAGLAVRNRDDDSVAVAHLRRARVSRKSSMVVSDLRAFAIEARSAGRPELAQLAEQTAARSPS